MSVQSLRRIYCEHTSTKLASDCIVKRNGGTPSTNINETNKSNREIIVAN